MSTPGQSVDFAAVFARLAVANAAEETITLGGMNVRMVRVPGGGPGCWDSHVHTAETAIVWSGDFSVEFRDGTVSLTTGQCCIVPVKAEHRGTSREGAEVILLTQLLTAN